MKHFLGALELRRTVFRSDHASNWLVLKGTLGADKARLLQVVLRRLINRMPLSFGRCGRADYSG